METQQPTLNTVSFSWDKTHNDVQLANIDDELYCTFREIELHANISFRRNPKTRIDEIILNIHRMQDQKPIKLCEISCNPGQYRTMPFIMEEVRKALQKIIPSPEGRGPGRGGG